MELANGKRGVVTGKNGTIYTVLPIKKEAKPILMEIVKKFGINKTYSNTDIEFEFAYSGKSLNESVAKQNSSYDNMAKMFTTFDDIIENAVAIEAHGDRYVGTDREDPFLRNTYVLVSAYRDGKNFIPVKLVVKEFTQNAAQLNKIYMAVTAEKIGADLLAQPASTAQGGGHNYATSAPELSVAELVKKIKEALFNYKHDYIQLWKDAPPSTLAHEAFHRYDMQEGISGKYRFGDILRKEYETMTRDPEDLLAYMRQEYPEAFKESIMQNVKLEPAYRGISDIISGLTKNSLVLGYKHKTSYWGNDDIRLGREAWAQLGRILYENDPRVIAMLKDLFPKFYECAMIAVKGVK